MSVKCGMCGGPAYVADKQKSQVKLQCLDCKVTWKVDSKICPKCRRPNGYAVEGLCAQCYSLGRY